MRYPTLAQLLAKAAARGIGLRLDAAAVQRIAKAEARQCSRCERKKAPRRKS